MSNQVFAVGKVVNGRIIMVSKNGGSVKPVGRPVVSINVEEQVVVVQEPVEEVVETVEEKHVVDITPSVVRKHVQRDLRDNVVFVDFPQHEQPLPELIVDWARGLGRQAIDPLKRYFFDGDSVRNSFKGGDE